MKNTLSFFLIFSTVIFSSAVSMAADRVVVIPLGKNDPNLIPDNIAYGVTILGVTGTLPRVVTSAGGQVWMDRNLGASRVATSPTDSAAYGYLFQWGRSADGHQQRTSGTIQDMSDTDNPGHDNFILTETVPYDWRSSPNDGLWQSVSGSNNPCPSGFKIPTEAEWEIERASWGSDQNATGAFNSPLKLVLGGYRYHSFANSSIMFAGVSGNYWSSTVDGTDALDLNFGDTGTAGWFSNPRAAGFSVRCITD